MKGRDGRIKLFPVYEDGRVYWLPRRCPIRVGFVLGGYFRIVLGARFADRFVDAHPPAREIGNRRRWADGFRYRGVC